MKKLVLICLCILFAAATDETRGWTVVLSSTQRTSPVAVGEIAPDFTLADQNGNKVTLSDSRNKNPVVLVFYRAYW